MRRKYSRSSAGRVGATEVFTRPQRSAPAVLLVAGWRWRWEIVSLAGVAWCWIQLDSLGWSTAQTVGLAAAVVVAVAGVGPLRRFVRNRWWCVVTRHRVRTCLSEVRTLNYSGGSPWILSCRATKTGESVWVGLRAGLSEQEVANRVDHIAAACWARSVTIGRHAGNAALVRFDIERRDPFVKQTITSPHLTTIKKPVESTGSRYVVKAHGTEVPGWDQFESTPPPVVIPDRVIPHDDTTEPTHAGGSVVVGTVVPSKRQPHKPSKPVKAVGGSVLVAVTKSGEDVSDYV